MPDFVVIKHLPLTNPEHLFGRDEELAWLEKCWTERAFVASIAAWGGVGKTSLVTKWLCAMRDAGWPGAERVFVWSFYGQGTRTGSSDGFIAAALAKFGDADPTQGSLWDKGDRLANLVREKRTLLVLDGVEPMQWGPGEQEGHFKDPALQTLVQALALQNDGLLLLTSRLPIRDAEALAGAKVQSKALRHLSEEAGAQLLRAHKVQGTEEELRAAVREYEGHALALTLLGSYIRKAQMGDIRRRDRIVPLQGKPAQRMMAIYEEWFSGRLELTILQLMGFFDRPATKDEMDALRALPWIEGLTDGLEGVLESDWNEAVTTLRDVGLMSVAKFEHDETLDAHPLVRQHFGELLEQDNLDAYREGHRRLYEFLQRKAPPFPDTLADMEPLYNAVVHGCLAGRNQEALDEVWEKRILRGEEQFSIHKLGAFGHEVAMLWALFEPPWEHLAPGLSEADQVFVLNAAGIALDALGRLQEAEALLKLSTDIHVAQNNFERGATSASNLSLLRQSRGNLLEALEAAEQSVELADKSSDAFLRVASRIALATVKHAMGRRHDALALFEEAERMQNETQSTIPLLYSVQGSRYCDLLLDWGREVDVRKRAGLTLIWANEHEFTLDIALNHLTLGRAYLVGVQRNTGGDLANATAHLQQAVDGLHKAGYQVDLLLGLLARADLHIHMREFANARRDLNEAMTIATRCGFRLHECDAHLGHARLAIAEGNVADARTQVEKARAIINETGYHRRDRDLAMLETMTQNQILAPATPVSTTPQSPATSNTASPPVSPTNTPSPVTMAQIAFNFHPTLVDAYRNGKLAILFGSGLSIADDVQGNFPRWTELPDRLLNEVAHQGVWQPEQVDALRSFFKSGHVSLDTMLAGLDMTKTALEGSRQYRSALAAIFRPVNEAPGDVHRALVETGVQILLTTNYDSLLERLEGPPAREVFTWQKADQGLHDVDQGRKVLFKIHGTAGDADSIVMTKSEYDKAAAHPPYQHTMGHLLQTYTFLLVGYGINDPLDLDLVFELNTKAFGHATRTHYALMKNPSGTDRDRWLREMNIQTIPYGDHNELPGILRALVAQRGSTNPP